MEKPRSDQTEPPRPPRHSGDDDVALDRALRDKDEAHRKKPEMDAIHPRRGTTAPGDNGHAPEDIDVAMPEDYGDDWK